MASSSSAAAAAAAAAVPDKLAAWRAELQAEALEIVYKRFPARIEALSRLFAEAPAHGQAPLTLAGRGAVLNAPILAFRTEIKLAVLEMLRDLDVLRTWISLKVPTTEDGNSFGVSIQNEVVELLQSGRMSGMGVLETTTKYHENRGKLVSKLLKHAAVSDYRVSLQQLDEKEWMVLKSCANDLRNNYAVLLDILHKNWARLTKPKGTQQGKLSMY